MHVKRFIVNVYLFVFKLCVGYMLLFVKTIHNANF